MKTVTNGEVREVYSTPKEDPNFTVFEWFLFMGEAKRKRVIKLAKSLQGITGMTLQTCVENLHAMETKGKWNY